MDGIFNGLGDTLIPSAYHTNIMGIKGVEASIKDYVKGSYAYDPTPGQESAEIATRFDADGSHPASLTLLGGSAGATFRIAKFVGIVGQPINAVTVSISVKAGEQTTIGTGNIVDANHQNVYIITLTSTGEAAAAAAKAAAEKVAAEKAPGYEHLDSDRRQPTPSAFDQFKNAMMTETVGPVPNGVWVGIAIITIIGGSVAVVSRKKN
jgi:hypothetical protein